MKTCCVNFFQTDGKPSERPARWLTDRMDRLRLHPTWGSDACPTTAIVGVDPAFRTGCNLPENYKKKKGWRFLDICLNYFVCNMFFLKFGCLVVWWQEILWHHPRNLAATCCHLVKSSWCQATSRKSHDKTESQKLSHVKINGFFKCFKDYLFDTLLVFHQMVFPRFSITGLWPLLLPEGGVRFHGNSNLHHRVVVLAGKCALISVTGSLDDEVWMVMKGCEDVGRFDEL